MSNQEFVDKHRQDRPKPVELKIRPDEWADQDNHELKQQVRTLQRRKEVNIDHFDCTQRLIGFTASFSIRRPMTCKRLSREASRCAIVFRKRCKYEIPGSMLLPLPNGVAVQEAEEETTPHEAVHRLMNTFKVDGLTRALTRQL
jgi:hypothetical protein